MSSYLGSVSLAEFREGIRSLQVLIALIRLSALVTLIT